MFMAAQLMFQTEDAHEQAEIFIKTFQTVLNSHAPLKEVRAMAGKIRHVLSQETLRLRTERNSARNSWLKAMSPQEKKIKMEAYTTNV